MSIAISSHTIHCTSMCKCREASVQRKVLTRGKANAYYMLQITYRKLSQNAMYSFKGRKNRDSSSTKKLSIDSE